MTEMGKFNEELVKAGVLLAAEGLHPSSKGARVKFSGTTRTVIDGPFAETKELIDGFAVIEVPSKAAAIAVAQEFMQLAGDGTGEILQMFDPGGPPPGR
jgi:hypothetical protein